MSLFGSLDISGSGIDASQAWLNTTAGNIANMNDVTSTDKSAYGVQTPVFTPIGVAGQVGAGVTVSGIQEGDTTGIVQFDPSSPVADAQGNVRVPDVQLGAQMVEMIQAQTDYQANTASFADAKTAYQSALTIGT
ncbi:MAG TPA: flagellar basal body rod C-terminal domain-containing protein [Acidimicrobiales bacterium]|nr:flagellar basal body rod C-terminal domain-containing protein [Acidimicrobiales bacterium]